jgi:hypothetical protein
MVVTVGWARSQFFMVCWKRSTLPQVLGWSGLEFVCSTRDERSLEPRSRHGRTQSVLATVVDLDGAQPLYEVDEIVLVGDRDDLAGFDHFGVADHLSVESLMWEESQEQGEGAVAVRVVC